MIAGAAPKAAVCFDPFHVVTLANSALDQVRRAEWNAGRRGGQARAIKHTRGALLKRPERLSDERVRSRSGGRPKARAHSKSIGSL